MKAGKDEVRKPPPTGRITPKDNTTNTNNNNMTVIDPSTTTLMSDRPLQAFKEQLQAAQAALVSAQAQLASAQPAYVAARAALEKSQNRDAIGVAHAGELATSQQAFDDARLAYARAEAAMEDAQRLVDTLPDVIREREQALRAVIRDHLRQQAMEKAAQLAAILAQAKALSDDLMTLHDHAEREFPVNGLLRVGCGGLLGVEDLGDVGGYVTRAAGIPALHSPWLSNERARSQPSLFDLWLKQVNNYLAVSPAERAEHDKQNRVHALEQDKVHQRDEAVKQAAWERWIHQGLEPVPTVQPAAPHRTAVPVPAEY